MLSATRPNHEVKAEAYSLERKAKEFLAAGQFDEAIDRAGKIDIREIRDCAWRCIAYVLVEGGKRERAIQVAELIGDDTIRMVALGVISSSYIEAGCLKEAVDIAFQTNNGKDVILKCIVESLVACGRISDAVNIAATISVPIEQAFSYRAIAIDYYHKGDLVNAQKMAEKIPFESIKPRFS